MKNFINIGDLDKKDLREIIDQAKLQKKKEQTSINLQKIQKLHYLIKR